MNLAMVTLLVASLVSAQVESIAISVTACKAVVGEHDAQHFDSRAARYS